MNNYIDIICDTCGYLEIITKEEAKELDDGYGVVGEESCPSYMGCGGNMVLYSGRQSL